MHPYPTKRTSKRYWEDRSASTSTQSMEPEIAGHYGGIRSGLLLALSPGDARPREVHSVAVTPRENRYASLGAREDAPTGRPAAIQKESPHSAPRSIFEAVETARSLPFGARPPGRREGVARAGRLGPCVVRASVWARGRLHTQVSHGNVVGAKLCVCVKGGPLAQQSFVNAAKFCEVELRVPEGMSPSILQRWCHRACRGLFGIALGRTRCTAYRHRVHWCEVLTASIDASR